MVMEKQALSHPIQCGKTRKIKPKKFKCADTQGACIFEVKYCIKIWVTFNHSKY